MQNRAMRCIRKKSLETRINDMLDELNWHAYMYYDTDTCNTIFKIKKNLLPRYLSCNLRLNSEIHNRYSRNKNGFRLPNYNKQCSRSSLFHRGVQKCNELSNEMLNCTTLSLLFKRLCFGYVKPKPIGI